MRHLSRPLLLLALTLALTLAVALPVAFTVSSRSATVECTAGATRDAFIQAAKRIPVKVIYTLSKPAVKLWLAAMKANSGNDWDADEVLFAPLPDGDAMGVVLIKNGCVVIGSVIRIPTPVLVQFISDAGIKPEDILKLSEA